MWKFLDRRIFLGTHANIVGTSVLGFGATRFLDQNTSYVTAEGGLEKFKISSARVENFLHEYRVWKTLQWGSHFVTSQT